MALALEARAPPRPAPPTPPAGAPADLKPAHRNQALDGLRAIAIGLVFDEHFGGFLPGTVGVDVFFGLDPDTAFLGDAIDSDDGGFLVTSPTMETSIPGVFAAGDVRSGSTKQLGSALGDGIAALLMTRRRLEERRQKAVSVLDA